MYDEILEHECGCGRRDRDEEEEFDCECGEDCDCGCECGEDEVDPFERPYKDFAKYVMVPDADGDEDIVSGSES